MQKLKAPPTLLAEKGQIEYVALLILALENPIPDPEGNMTTYDLTAWVIRIILFNSGLNLYDCPQGLGDYIDCFKFLYPHYFNAQPFLVFLP